MSLCVHACEYQRHMRFSELGYRKWRATWCQCWELNSNPLQEALTFLFLFTEPSLQLTPKFEFFEVYCLIAKGRAPPFLPEQLQDQLFVHAETKIHTSNLAKLSLPMVFSSLGPASRPVPQAWSFLSSPQSPGPGAGGSEAVAKTMLFPFFFFFFFLRWCCALGRTLWAHTVSLPALQQVSLA